MLTYGFSRRAQEDQGDKWAEEIAQAPETQTAQMETRLGMFSQAIQGIRNILI